MPFARSSVSPTHICRSQARPSRCAPLSVGRETTTPASYFKYDWCDSERQPSLGLPSAASLVRALEHRPTYLGCSHTVPPTYTSTALSSALQYTSICQDKLPARSRGKRSKMPAILQLRCQGRGLNKTEQTSTAQETTFTASTPTSLSPPQPSLSSPAGPSSADASPASGQDGSPLSKQISADIALIRDLMQNGALQ